MVFTFAVIKYLSIYIYIYIYIVKMPNSTALLPHICLHFETKVRSLYCVLLYPLAL